MKERSKVFENNVDYFEFLKKNKDRIEVLSLETGRRKVILTYLLYKKIEEEK